MIGDHSFNGDWLVVTIKQLDGIFSKTGKNKTFIAQRIVKSVKFLSVLLLEAVTGSDTFWQKDFVQTSKLF